ncbi:hypothetical protein GCM10008018_33270 [Paenibacillus marchantiophytorum]|uniref:YncE family protein n=1 Tax=Paenibacillus marchantiophytorum TaxID=1619310 RepID=A0ABQ1ES85_9BACL|nr:YncE family protein [Paenibacillus marchantiophytorum]GFZ84656.1 hypothetical protein GCM10008018_33270 [Paenibacillus marchantiophytorum]
MNRLSQTPTQVKAQSKLPKVLSIIPVAGDVGDIQVNSVTNRVYYVHSENQVGVLNGATQQVIQNVKVGEGATYLAVNSATNRIYVTNFRDATVSVMDGQTNRVLTSVPVGQRPFGLGIDPKRNRIYVANLGGTISIIDGSSNRVVQTLKVGGAPALVSVNERTNRIYVTNVEKDLVHVISGTSLRVIKSLKVGRNPIVIPGINRVTNRIYIANNLSNYASLIQGNTLLPSIPIHLGSRQSELAMNALTNRIYVTSAQQEGRGKLFVLDGDTNRIVKTLRIPTFASLLVNPLTNHYFIGDTDNRNLFVYGGQNNELLTTLRTGNSSGNMALNTRTNQIYVGNTGTITVVQDERDTTTSASPKPLLAKRVCAG